jgi:enhancer of polycomb-like protein
MKAKPKLDAAVIQRGMPGMVPKLPQDRLDARAPDSAVLLQLEDQRRRRHDEIENMIQDNINKHRVWNNDWVDQTWRPITPPLETANQSSFRTAITEFLPTPPASVSEETGDGISMAERTPRPEGADKEKSMIRYASPPAESTPRPSYRKRFGRGGRLFIDRRGLKRPCLEDLPSQDAEGDVGKAERMRGRMQYDLESDDDSTPVYANDFWDEWNIRYRIAFAGTAPNQQAAAQQQRMIEEAQRRQQAAASANAVINGPAAAGARAALPAARAAS